MSNEKPCRSELPLTSDGSRLMTREELFRARHCARCIPRCPCGKGRNEDHREGCTHVCTHVYQQYAPSPPPAQGEASYCDHRTHNPMCLGCMQDALDGVGRRLAAEKVRADALERDNRNLRELDEMRERLAQKAVDGARDRAVAAERERDEARANCNANHDAYKLAFERVQHLEAALARLTTGEKT